MGEHDIYVLVSAALGQMLTIREDQDAAAIAETVRRTWPSLGAGARHRLTQSFETDIIWAERTMGPERTAMCKALLEEVRPPKAPFTVDYRCGKCGVDGVKLWRGTHGCPLNGHELLCAACLAPGEEVDGEGRVAWRGSRIDQMHGGLPAVPVDDTFWGYSSVPTADVRWWKALPTYPTPTPKAGTP